MNFNAKINKVTLDQSAKWISRGFNEISKNPKVFLLNVASVAALTSFIDVLVVTFPQTIFLKVFYFCILGTVILNLNYTRNNNSFMVGFYEGFRPPYLMRLLRACFFFALAFIGAVLAGTYYLYCKGFFEPQNFEIVQKVTSLFTNPASLVELTNILAKNPGNFDAFQQLLPGVDFNVLLTLLQQLIVAIEITLLIMLIVASYFWLVPFFCTLAYEDLRNQKVNMYALSFRTTFSFKNWLPFITFSLAVFVIMVVFNMLFSGILNQLAQYLYVQVVIRDILGACMTCFLVYACYFMFLDLFSDSKEEGETVKTDEMRRNTSSEPVTEVKKF